MHWCPCNDKPTEPSRHCYEWIDYDKPFLFADSEYASGTVAGPRVSKDGFDLPSARKLSTAVTKTSANRDRKDAVNTVMVMQMGQFIDHDITHTPNHAKVRIYTSLIIICSGVQYKLTCLLTNFKKMLHPV